MEPGVYSEPYQAFAAQEAVGRVGTRNKPAKGYSQKKAKGASMEAFLMRG